MLSLMYHIIMKQAGAYSKPKKCPRCGSCRVSNLLVSSVSGKKCTSDSHPGWYCEDCGIKIHLKTTRRCRVKKTV